MFPIYLCIALCWLKIVFGQSDFLSIFPGNKTYIDFSYQPQKVVLLPLEPLLLNCEIRKFFNQTVFNNDSLPAEVVWFKNNHPLKINGLIPRIKLQNGSLYKSVVQTSDSGLYQCRATYEGKVLLSLKAKVTVLPQVQSFPDSISNCPSSVVYLKCAFENNENRPIVTWYKNNHRIGSNAMNSQNRYLIERHSGYSVLPNGTLEITRTISSTSGRYQCKAETKNGVKPGNQYELRDSEDCLLPHPHFTAQPTDTIVTTGKSALFTCSVSGRTEGLFKWFKDKQEIQFRSSPRFQMVGQASLLIEDAQLLDDGEYSCKFESATVTLTASARLTVFEPPRLRSVVTRHLRLTHYGCEVVLPCNMTGSPIPVVTWFKDGQVIGESETRKLQNDQLLLRRITGESDSGIYQCFAENEVGQNQIAYQMLVVSQDSVDLSVTSWNDSVRLNSINPSSAVISWSPFQLFRPTSYTIVVIDDTENKRLSYESEKTEYEVENLKANHSIRISVSPRSRICSGPTSQMIAFVVPNKADELHHGIVQSFAVQPLTDRADVTWTHPANYRGGHIQYQAIMTELESSPPKIKNLTTTNTSCVFTDLEPYTAYGFKVAVVSPSGDFESITREFVTKTLVAAPNSPPDDVIVHFEGGDRARVTWTAPPRSDWNAPSIGYRVKFKEASGGARPKIVPISFPRSSVVLKGLKRNKDYWLRMQTTNSEGFSPLSRKLYFKTTEMSGLVESTRPGKPRAVEAKGLSREIYLTWTAPDDGVHVTQYVIGWGKSGPYDHTVIVTGESEFYRIANLAPSTEYYIRLAAKNGFGQGQEALTAVRTAPIRTKQPEELFPPLGVQVKVLTHTTINVSWHDAESGQADRSYLVRYKTNVPDLPRVGYINSTGITSVITGLRPHTVYEIAVRVIQGPRKSTWSMTATVTTNESKPGSPPTDVTLMPIDNKPTFVQLNWQPPVEPNGELTGYMIFYTTNPDLEIDNWVIEPVPGGKLSTTIDGLTEDTQYYFKALALNRKGESPYSDLVAYRTPSVKGEVKVEATTKPMAKWMWYVIVGSVAILVISIAIVSAILICRNRKSKSSKRNKSSNSVHRHSTGIRSTSGESWPYSVKSAQSAASVPLRADEHRFEMRSIRTNDNIFPSEFQKYRANPVAPAELEPLNAAPYGDSYPYASRPHRHGDVMRSPMTSDSGHRYPTNGRYGNSKPIPFSNLQRSTCEIAQYDIDYRYPYDGVPLTQDYAVDSAYGSDHQHHHAIDDQPSSRPLKIQSSRRHKPSYNDDRLPSERSSPITDSLHSTHGSETLSDDSAHLENVKEFLRTVRSGSELDPAAP